MAYKERGNGQGSVTTLKDSKGKKKYQVRVTVGSKFDAEKERVIYTSKYFEKIAPMCVRHNSEGEFTSIREEDIPVIEKNLVAIMPDNLTEYKEAE